MARLTCKSNPIDGMGFGGSGPIDKNTVSGALAFAHPSTGDKLSKYAEHVARYVWCDDKGSQYVLTNQLFLLARQRRTKIAPKTLMRIVKAALEEFKTPRHRTFGADREQSIKPVSRSHIANAAGITKQSYSNRHHDIYEATYQHIAVMASEADQHIEAAMAE